MDKSQRLRLRDVQNVFRLIGECRELGADSRAWREHMFAELCRLLGARVGIGGEALRLWNGPDEVLQTIDLGWDDENERRSWLTFMVQRYKDGPLFQGMLGLSGHLRTRSRRQIIEDRVWYRTVDFNEYMRPSGLDHSLQSFYTLPDDPYQTTNGITLNRALGDPAFSRRDMRILRLFHAELGPLIGRSLATAREPSALDLPPRVRQALECLLEGDAEKQIAHRLGISQETVHQYVKTIYRHYRVNSRPELLARWVRFGWGRASSLHEPPPGAGPPGST